MLEYNDFIKMKKKELIDFIISERSPMLKNIQSVLHEVRSLKIDYSQENFILIALSTSLKVLSKEILFKGGPSKATISPAFLFRKLLMIPKCISFIILHNHPSGDTSPSKQDINITKSIKTSSQTLDLNLLGHIIFSENNYYSLRNETDFI